MAAGRPEIVAVRGRGLLIGVEMADPRRAGQVVDSMREHGVLIGRTGPRHELLKIRPPLVFCDEHIPVLIDALVASLCEVNNWCLAPFIHSAACAVE